MSYKVLPEEIIVLCTNEHVQYITWVVGEHHDRAYEHAPPSTGTCISSPREQVPTKLQKHLSRRGRNAPGMAAQGGLAAWAETGRGKRRGKIADDAPAFTNYIHHQEGHEAVDQEGEEGAEAVGYVT